MTDREQFMHRALTLARLGEGRVSPNPMVGCVVVKDGRIISEGYHERYGGYHAERNALLSAEEDCEGADLYVTLEPCCHYGKTPPCTEIILFQGSFSSAFETIHITDLKEKYATREDTSHRGRVPE